MALLLLDPLTLGRGSFLRTLFHPDSLRDADVGVLRDGGLDNSANLSV